MGRLLVVMQWGIGMLGLGIDGINQQHGGAAL